MPEPLTFSTGRLRPEPAPAAQATEPKAAAPAEPKAASGKQDVEKAIRDWAAAWSKKDVKGYLAAYARDFQTPGGEARDTWEAERARRINRPDPIQVGVENLQVVVEGERATAKFRQNYRSGKLKTSASKAMVLVHRDGKWLIQEERVAN